MCEKHLCVEEHQRRRRCSGPANAANAGQVCQALRDGEEQWSLFSCLTSRGSCCGLCLCVRVCERVLVCVLINFYLLLTSRLMTSDSLFFIITMVTVGNGDYFQRWRDPDDEDALCVCSDEDDGLMLCCRDRRFTGTQLHFRTQLLLLLRLLLFLPLLLLL